MGVQAIIDTDIRNMPIFIQTSKLSNGSLAGSIVLNNVKLTNVFTAVGVANGNVILSGTTLSEATKMIPAWAQGNVYHGTNTSPTFIQADITPPHQSLLTPEGRIIGRMCPQYEDHLMSGWSEPRFRYHLM